MGTELARRFERTPWRDAWHAQYSQIRPELDRMASDELITVVATGARRRRTYSITRGGQSELQRWLQNPPERFVTRSEFVVRLFLLSTLDPANARTLLAPIVDATARELATRPCRRCDRWHIGGRRRSAVVRSTCRRVQPAIGGGAA